MKKFLIISLIIILNSCSGYEPIFSGKEINFYIQEIKNTNNNKATNQIIRKLKPYTIVTNKTKIKMEIDTSSYERIVSKNAKGDPVVFELTVEVKIKISGANKVKNLNYIENFSFNNQSNKFELNQYKKNIKNNLINKIFEKLIFNLKSSI